MPSYLAQAIAAVVISLATSATVPNLVIAVAVKLFTARVGAAAVLAAAGSQQTDRFVNELAAGDSVTVWAWAVPPPAP